MKHLELLTSLILLSRTADIGLHKTLPGEGDCLCSQCSFRRELWKLRKQIAEREPLMAIGKLLKWSKEAAEVERARVERLNATIDGDDLTPSWLPELENAIKELEGEE